MLFDTSSVSESFFFLFCVWGEGSKEGHTFVWEALEDGIAMIFSHHIYYAQSKVKWGAMGGGYGVNEGAMAHRTPSPLCYATF